MSPANWLLLLATASSFATSLTFNKALIADIGPLTLAALRAVLAFPMMWIVTRASGAGLPLSRDEAPKAIVASLLLVVVPFAAIAWGQQYITSGLGGILFGSMPLLTVLIAHVLIADERLSFPKLLGIVVGLAGVVSIIGPSALAGVTNHLLGELVTLCGPLSYAFGIVYLRRHRAMNPLSLTAGIFLFGQLFLIPLAFLLETPLSLRVDLVNAALLLGLAAIGTALPAGLNNVLIQRVGATNASLTAFFLPAFAVLFGVVLLRESVTIGMIAGMALIIAGSQVVARVR